MKKYLTEYLNEVKSFINFELKNASVDRLDEMLSNMEIKISYFQHERLIHLLVTLTFALLEIITIVAMNISFSLVFVALSVLFLVLLVPYVFHYYFLENSVQELYKLRDTIYSRRNKKVSKTSEE